jgi:hypothetical protein
VTLNTGFGFHDRIYWTFIQLVTTVHTSLIHCRLIPTHLTRLSVDYDSLRLLVVSHCRAYNISAQTAQKTLPSSIVASHSYRTDRIENTIPKNARPVYLSVA